MVRYIFAVIHSSSCSARMALGGLIVSIIIVIIMLIEHIAIARKNGRIVIFMEFHHLEEGRNPKVSALR